ncbi:hypothetical protein [Paraburkholderia tuberum]|uniref:hypothetical protein n=1 Tax=Paraburkholderia TaxID=1822464 RepID=UPI00036EA126|nr:hypothetical protein [Paraburkholderia tuberum]
MESTSKHPPGSGIKNASLSPRKPVATPTDTQQSRKDEQEKQKHAASENELQSAQDKNPIPPDPTRE